MKTVVFKSWKCEVVFAKYGNGATAIQLIDAEDKSPVATATVNLVPEVIGPDYRPSDQLPKNRCYIKTWSENEGMLEALIEAEVVMDFYNTIPVGPYGSVAKEVLIIDYKE